MDAREAYARGGYRCLTDLADGLRFRLAGEDVQAPAERDVATWLDMNSRALGPLGSQGAVAAAETDRLWAEAQTLLLGLLLRRDYVVGFLQEIDAVVRAARKELAEGRTQVTGDIYLVPASTSDAVWLNRLRILKSQIADFRRGERISLRSGGGHPAKTSGQRRVPAGQPVWNTAVPGTHDELSTRFLHAMSTAAQVQTSFSGETLELERAARCLERTFHEFSEDIAEPGLVVGWNRWLDAQAWLFWQFRHAPKHQGAEAQLDDYLQAERYLGFLIAEDLMNQVVRLTGCPGTFLEPVRIHYLSLLGVEDFLRIKAYFFYLARVRDGWDREEPSWQKLDHFAAKNWLGRMLQTFARRELGGDCENCGRQVAERLFTAFASTLPTRTVERATIRLADIARPRTTESFGASRAALRALYAWLEKGARSDTPSGVTDLLWKHLSAMNMFELFLMCLAAHKMPRNQTLELPDWARSDESMLAAS